MIIDIKVKNNTSYLRTEKYIKISLINYKLMECIIDLNKVCVKMINNAH